MTIRDLDKLLAPKSVALIGASARQGSVGATIARNLLDAGLPGPVWLVNPKQGEIAGVRCYENLASLPGTPDLAVIAIPPGPIPALIAELGERGTRAAVVITAAPHGDGAAFDAAMLARRKARGVRILGPNCLGMIVPGAGLNASFAHTSAPRRRPRARLAVGRHRHLGARLGEGARHRLFPPRLARQHDRRRCRRPARPSGARPQGAGDPALSRGHPRRPQLHVGGTGGGAVEAGHRAEGRPPRRRRPRRRLAHRRARRLRCGLRRRLRARRPRPRQRPRRPVRGGGGAEPARPHRRRAARHPHQWRRRRRAGGRPAETISAARLRQLSPKPSRRSTGCCRRLVARQSASTSSAMPGPTAMPRPTRRSLADPAVDAILVLNCPTAVGVYHRRRRGDRPCRDRGAGRRTRQADHCRLARRRRRCRGAPPARGRRHPRHWKHRPAPSTASCSWSPIGGRRRLLRVPATSTAGNHRRSGRRRGDRRDGARREAVRC